MMTLAWAPSWARTETVVGGLVSGPLAPLLPRRPDLSDCGDRWVVIHEGVVAARSSSPKLARALAVQAGVPDPDPVYVTERAAAG